MSRFLNPRFQGIAPYTPGEQPTGRKWVKLNTNESPYPPAPGVWPAVEKSLERIQLYPEISCESVHKPLSHFLGLPEDHLFIANGSDEVLAFCFWAFCPRGAAFADITYGFYRVFADMYEVDSLVLPLAEDYSLTPSDYHALGRTLFIANPNAPTGLALSRQEVETILRENRESLVVVDEAYIAFGGQTAVPLVKKYDNLLVTGTFSKSRSLAGARFGYAAGRPELIEDLGRMRYGFNPYNVNTMTMAAAIASLEDQAYYEDCTARIVKTRDKAQRALQEMGFSCTDSKANFLFVEHPEFSAKKLFECLRERGILVRWFEKPRIQNRLRITVGSEAEMQALLEAVERIVS
ncbi:histidinol-phosphate transaminase [Ruminococcaceae bacterium OttesenSCG-928-I18]|nr:histidinol-phosphate transaminase [Ruminococcaceae bacterium OttesenSCG-928-I18]